MSDDSQLLRQYLEGSEAAFGELVSRYVNLVYSAALRQIGIIEHAQDVAQSVFTTLARKARTLPPNVVLGGWLYRHTCFVSAQWLRTERRRQARERQAVIMNQPHEGSGPDWEKLAPVLDDAMKNLGDADRNAIVLRYFEKRELQSVGAALGISDEAARKRVSRALEKLRAQLARKGVTSTAAALALALTGNAVTAAPVGFAAILTSASLLGAATMGTGTTLTFLKALTMTKLQTAIVGAVIVAGVTTPLVIQHRANAALSVKDEVLQRQIERSARLESENERLSNLVAQATSSASLSSDQLNELLRLRGEVTRLQSDSRELAKIKAGPMKPDGQSDVPIESAAREWIGRVNFLKRQFEQVPDKKIPELQFLNNQDWLRISGTKLESNDEIRQSLARLRMEAKELFAPSIAKALRTYLEVNSDQLPTDMAQLKPYFDPQVDDEMLQRYRITVQGKASDYKGFDQMFVEEKAPVDSDYDWQLQVGLRNQRLEGVGHNTGNTSIVSATGDIRLPIKYVPH